MSENNETEKSDAAASPSKWETAERISRTLSIAAIPVVLAVGGWVIQKRLQDQSVSRDYVQLAVTILKEGPKDMNGWAVQLLNDNSPTKFTPEVVKNLSDGSIQLPANFNVGNAPTTASSTTPKENAEDWELKGFGSLFDRDAESALQAFRNAEKLSPQLHSVSEIRKLLEQKKAELNSAPKDGRSDVWKNLYQTVHDKYTWHVSPDVKTKLEDLIRNT